MSNDSAASFVSLLTGNADTPVTFQTFDDSKKKRGNLARTWTSSLDAAVQRLKALNDDGVGIFIAINECDGRGRKNENVTRVRAVFVDCDRPESDPLRLIEESGIDPDFIIESSPGKYHAYRRVSEFPLDKEIFAGVQLLLADRVQGDVSVKDLARVMRVPGFMHRKGEPFETRIHEVKHEGRATVYADLMRELDITEEQARQRARGNGATGVTGGAPVGPVDPNVDFSVRLKDGEGRNIHCTRLAGWCAQQGMSSERALTNVRAWNENLPEPLPDDKVVDIVSRMIRKDEEKRAGFSMTELGFSERVAYILAPRHRFAADVDSWLYWNGSVWEWDDSAVKLQEGVKRVARGLLDEAAQEADHDRRQALMRFNKACETRRAIQGSIALARSCPGMTVRSSELDSDPYLLACDNAVINLKTGTATRPDPMTLITHRAHVEYEPGVDCPRWRQFMNEVFDNDWAVIGYVQRALGYCLTGDTREEVAFIFVGHGQNGKSTLINTIQKLLGDYAQRMPSSALMVRRMGGGGSGPTPEIARLRGARLAVTSEVATGRQLDEELLKDLCSRDPIAARFLHKNTIEFLPTHKLVFALNHLPTIASSDHGTWRRIRVIPFNQTFDGRAKDAALPEKLMAEGPGILNWLIQGCLEWQREGLHEPDAVRVRTSDYRNDLDIVGNFIAECCCLAVDDPENDESYKTPAAELYRAYRRYCETYGLPCISHRLFGEDMKARKDSAGRNRFEVRRGAAGFIYHGVMVRPAWLAESTQRLACV